MSLVIHDYNIRAISVYGNTKPHKEHLKLMGGRWNPTLQCWFFSKKRRSDVEAYIAGIQKESQEPILIPCSKRATESLGCKATVITQLTPNLIPLSFSNDQDCEEAGQDGGCEDVFISLYVIGCAIFIGTIACLAKF